MWYRDSSRIQWRQTGLFPSTSRWLSQLAALTSGGPLPGSQAGDVPEIPAEAVAAVRTEDNGDVVTEYRVAGQLRMVKVVPVRGPTYYLVDRDGDGRMDPAKGEVPTTWFKLFSW